MSVVDLLPRHAKVMIDLEEMISHMQIGDCLQSERELASRFGVSRETIRKAMRSLCDSGVLESRQGSGTFVRKTVERPNVLPRATKLIGISVPTVEWPTIAKVVSGAEQCANETGYRMILTHDYGKPDLQLTQLRSMLSDGVDGLLIFLDRDNVSRPEYITLLQEISHRPEKAILIDRYLPDVEIPCVMADTIRGMYEVMQHLIMAGRRRPAIISWGPLAGIAERHRMTGFRNAMQDQNLEPAPVLHAELGYTDNQDQAAAQVVEKWLRDAGGKLPFDSIICFEDNMAFGAFTALEKAGLRVPEDVALTGFDNVFPELHKAKGLDLTTVEQPLTEIGRIAMKRLVARIQNDPDEAGMVRHTLLPPKLIVRSSCGSRMV